MSEATEAVAAEVADYARHGSWKTLEARLAMRIAAAEERGRRRGVEERDELRTLLRDVIPYAECGHRTTLMAPCFYTQCACNPLRARIAAVVPLSTLPAPRDSAPVCDAVVSSDPFREWRCGKAKGHEGPHSGQAPRDSGKEPVRDSDDDLRALGERWTGKDRK